MPGSIVFKSLDILLGVIPKLNQKTLYKPKDNSSAVEIYTLSDCPWSKRALKLLDSYSIKYITHLITNDEEFKEISSRTSINTFPQIFINEEFIGSYSELLDLSDKGIL